MYPITNAVKALFESEQRKVLRITGTDKNGATISITDDNVMSDSFQIDRYSCNGEKLEIGTAIAAQLTMRLENGGGSYDDIVFEGTELFVEVGIADWTQASPTVTYVPCGYFTPDEQPRKMSTISITALDRMTKFDVVADAETLSFPTTIAGLVLQVCAGCGVTLAQSISGLPNASVNVAAMPAANGIITCRNLIQWCAGIMGTNAWFDWNGLLRFSWYDNSTGYVSTIDNRYSSDLYEDDLTITGVEYTNASGIAIVEGTDDYAIDLTGNAIAGPLIATVLPTLNTALNGFSYRPFTAATVNAPYLWPMDAVTFTDKDGNDHTSVLTNVAFGLNGTTAMESRGMTYAVNKAAQPKGFTREQAQLISQVAQSIETDISDSLTQQEIFDRLTDNGAAQGLVLYNGQLYINASYIKSGILTLGGANNVNGELHILDANGNLIGTITKDGIGFQRTNERTGFFVSPYGSIAVGVKPADLESLDDDNSFQALSSGIVKVQNLYIYNTTVGQCASFLPVVGGGIAIYGETNTNAIANINPTESIFYSSLYTSGNLSVPYGHISTGDYIYANGDITSHGDVIAHGDVTAGAGVSATTDITAGGDITATGSVFAGTDVSADGNISAGGMITATGDIATDGNVVASGDVSADADITAGGTVTATGDISSGGSISADSDITAGGDISAGGTLYATGDISTNGSITADVDITAYGNIAADGDISSSANITADSDITAGGNISATGALSAGDVATTRANLRVLGSGTKSITYGSGISDFAYNLQNEVFTLSIYQSENIIVNNGSANFSGLLTRSSSDGYYWAGLLIGTDGQLLKVSRNGSGSNVSIVYQ